MKTRQIAKDCPYLGCGWFVQFWSETHQKWIDVYGPCSAVQADKYEKSL